MVRSCTLIAPSNIDKNQAKSTLNNYAYYLSVRGERLGKALEMTEKSNRLSPNNPVFLDTWAWVLYKKGDFEEALKYKEIYQTATDSLHDVQRDSNFKEIETKYDVVKKEEKIGMGNSILHFKFGKSDVKNVKY